MSTANEDNLNKVFMGAVVALLSWNIYTTHQLSIDVAVQTEKIVQLELRVAGE